MLCADTEAAALRPFGLWPLLRLALFSEKVRFNDWGDACSLLSATPPVVGEVFSLASGAADVEADEAAATAVPLLGLLAWLAARASDCEAALLLLLYRADRRLARPPPLETRMARG
jgi:hypothetical protein